MRFRKEGVRPAGRAFAGRRLGVALATGLALILTSLVVASPAANAAPFTWAYTNAAHLTCLGASGHNGPVRAYNCASSLNQVWHFGGTHGAYAQVINNGTNQCLSVSGGSTAKGAWAVTSNCNGNDDNYWEVANTALGTVSFLNQHSQMVLQINCNCNLNGGIVNQGPGSGLGNPNQLWYPARAS
jgi:Ricin-type beta-trefoil lectin domain-like